MGHYLSEMISPEELDAEQTRKEERRLNMARAIQEDIDRRGVANVLADIVLDPVLYKIHKS